MPAQPTAPLHIPSPLPLPLADMLLYASGGKHHRLRMATLALEGVSQGRQEYSPALALDLLLAAFECDPSDSGMARQSLRVGCALGGLVPELAHLLESAATGSTDPTSKGHPALIHWREGLKAWRDGHLAAAAQAFDAAGDVLPVLLEYKGYCLAALGREDEALALWSAVLRRRPWHTQLLLTAHDYAEKRHQPRPLPGPAAALFYSWNKARDLDAALASLADSHGGLPEGLALVACLDNGSTDATPEVLRRWKERWGERFLPVTLPVNVGAAAARNWLASLPEVRALPYAAYVDDDALLPPHWLGHLGSAVHHYPDAAVWGCRVVHAHDPWDMQCGPLHLQPLFNGDPQSPLPGEPEPAADTAPEVAFSSLLAEGQPFRLTDQFCSGPDCGAHAYMRPCASVTGCCHLFRTEELAAQGFSLNFSPSQYDDAQRDLCMLQQGRMACYTGFCTVRHAKRTGQGTKTASGLSAAAYGNGLGNRYKLHGCFDAAAIATCVQHEYAILQQDLQTRRTRLEQCGVLC